MRICSSRWAPRGVQRICCFLTMRLLMTWLTVDSVNAVEMASPHAAFPVVGDPPDVGDLGPGLVPVAAWP